MDIELNWLNTVVRLDPVLNVYLIVVETVLW
jgi:hypothetical protein